MVVGSSYQTRRGPPAIHVSSVPAVEKTAERQGCELRLDQHFLHLSLRRNQRKRCAGGEPRSSGSGLGPDPAVALVPRLHALFGVLPFELRHVIRGTPEWS